MTALLLSLGLLAQTLPRPAAPFDFTLLDGTAKHLPEYSKNRIVVLYLFSPT